MKPIWTWKLGRKNADRSNRPANHNPTVETYRQMTRIHAAVN